MSVRVKILTQFWLIYFLITIAVIGAPLAAIGYFPLLGLSLGIPRARRWAEELLAFGARFLLKVQPWLVADVQFVIPSAPQVLLVSNHRSHLDVFFLISRIAGLRILARSTLFRIPGLGIMMRATRQIGVARGDLSAWAGAMDMVRKYLRLGEKVHIFPEMTRCPHGFKGLQQFTLAPFLAAMQEDAVVVPVVFVDTDQTWPKGVAGIYFRRPIKVYTLKPIPARDFATADELKSKVWQSIEQSIKGL